MLASLNIRRWQAALTDKKITAEVATNHAVNANRAGHIARMPSIPRHRASKPS